MKNFVPLNDEEKAILPKVIEIYKLTGPLHCADYSKYEGIAKNRMPAAGVLDAYNSCMIQPDPAFSVENNYYATERYANNVGKGKSWIAEKLITKDGDDITDTVKEAESWLMQHSLAGDF